MVDEILTNQIEQFKEISEDKLGEKETALSRIKENEARIYELSFIFSPLLSPEDMVHKFGDLKNLLTVSGAQFITEEIPRLIPLAYTMVATIGNKKYKFNNGYFGWVKFELNQEGVLNLKDSLKTNEDIVRHLLIKTVRENTLAPRKPMNRERFSSKPRYSSAVKSHSDKPEDKEVTPMDKEAVDKKIEELIS